MWDSPYHASRLLMASMGRVSGMTRSQIGLTDGGVGGYGLVVALGKHLAARQHGNAIAQISDHTEIVLDHQYRALYRKRFDQCADAGDVFVAHSRHGFVEQQHFRIERESGCDFE